MPHAVRKGDHVDIEGVDWTVVSATWLVDDLKRDKHGASLVTLIVRIK